MASTIKIYGPRSGSALRTHWIAAELGTAYEPMPVDFSKGENRSDWFLKINPMGQVPALVDGDFALAESMAIGSYLIDLAGSPLGGKTPQERALAWQWSIWVSLNPHPQLAMLASPAWTGKPLAPEAEAAAKAAVARYLPVLEGHLGRHSYVAGTAFTVGDINVACALTYAALSKYDLTPYPAITAWMAKVMARPAFAQAKGTPAK
ncbi:MAG TPA: glutathione S-transferase family protein [Polyangia bacterium]|nr:glutathione S-transferase family protein [Polyangia bacterium]